MIPGMPGMPGMPSMSASSSARNGDVITNPTVYAQPPEYRRDYMPVYIGVAVVVGFILLKKRSG